MRARDRVPQRKALARALLKHVGFFPKLESGEAVLRKRILAQGGSLRPGPTSRVWHAWANRTLHTGEEVALAKSALGAAGLGLHPDSPKNWDALVALGAILEATSRRDRVLEMGARRYSPLLGWLYQYGYRSLTGIDLVYTEPIREGPIQLLPMDLTATSFPTGSFGAIACLSVLEHGVDARAYLREAARLLAPGGVLVTSTDYWPEPIDTRGLQAYGQPVHIFARAAIEGFVRMAAEFGLRPTGRIDLDGQEKVVHWERMGLDYTFLVLLMRRDGPRRWWRAMPRSAQ